MSTFVPDEIKELYDSQADPQELKNLALDPASRATLDEYRALLRAELKCADEGALFAPPSPCR